MPQESPPLVRMPQGRQALGLGLVVVAGLLYVTAGFAIKAITERGVSPFLVSYISSCLFVLHLPCAAIARWWQGGGKLGFQELAPKDKTSDRGGSPEAASPRGWRELTAFEGEEDRDGGESGYDSLRGLGSSDGGGVESREETGPQAAGLLPLVPEEGFADMNTRGESEPQTPIMSVLEAWRVPAAPVELADLSGPGNLVSAGKVQPRNQSSSKIAGARRLEKQIGSQVEEQGSSLEDQLEGDRQGRLQFLPESGPDLEGARCGAPNCPEPGMRAYHGFIRVLRLAPSKLYPEHWEAVKIAAAVGPLWFLAQYIYTLALTLTTVSTNTILFSTTSLFTFLISIVWLKEPFTLFKLAMIALAMLGTVIVSVSNSKSKSDTPSSSSTSGAGLGSGLTLLASLTYAIYATTVKYKMPDENEEEYPQSPSSSKRGKRPVSTSLVFGYMGVLSGLFLLPCLAVLALTGLESLRWMGAKTCGLLIIKGLLGNVVADYLCARAMLLTNPTVASVGLATQTPVAIVADLFIFGIYPKPLMLVGGILVIWGFLGINLDLGTASSKA